MIRVGSECRRLAGNIGPMKTIPVTRSGCSAASRRPRWVPRDSATQTARSTPQASITSIASWANSRSS